VATGGKTVLIIGGSGFLGSHLALKLRDEHKVFATYCNHPVRYRGVTTLPMDLGNPDWIKRAIYTASPDVVVHAVGSNNLKKSDDESREAEWLHVSSLAPILKAATIFQPRLIYLSNCYTFDGAKGNYRETDTILAQTTLGKLKIAGENFVRGRALNYNIVRLSPVYGRSNGNNLSFLDILRIRLSRKLKTEVDATEVHSFAHVDTVTDLVSRLIEIGPRNKVHHFGGLTKCTYLDLARAFAKRYRFDPSLIVPLPREQSSTAGLEQTEFDFSMNSTETIHTLKVRPLLLEEGLDLFERRRTADGGDAGVESGAQAEA
jgi:dTDP-4-dehydrorhamnose reductase